MTQLPLWQSLAPANTMIMGEHAVVYGQPALVAALDQWLTIDWTPLDTADLVINSELAQHTTSLAQLEIHPQLGFVGDALLAFAPALRDAQQGWQLSIRSHIGTQFGLGSSAAVLAACLVGLNTLTASQYSLLELWQLGRRIIRQRQGRGSAADLAASLYGGLVYLQPENPERPAPQITPLAPAHYASLQLGLVYAGYKTPTAEVLAWVAQHWQHRPTERDQLYQQMGQITQQAYQAIAQQAWSDFYANVNRYQDCMVQLGVSDKTLDHLISLVSQRPNMGAAKISGSGLGDCIIAFSHHTGAVQHGLQDASLQAWSHFCLPITAQGASMTPRTNALAQLTVSSDSPSSHSEDSHHEHA